MPASNPVIFVPGITATYLRDQYPIPPEIVWSVLKKKYERAALHPDDLRFEAQEPARILPDQLYEIAYEEMIEELRFNLRDAEDDPVPVYPFGYDWRHPLDVIESQLADFIEEVIARTKLMRNYHPEYAADPKVNLVGHSMGGLIIAGYLEAHGGSGRVAKVATLASPFRGSFESVIKITTGTANLGTKAPSSREREAARVTPALYHLLPRFEAGLVIDPPIDLGMFSPAAWQPSILGTISEFIRLNGVDADKSEAERHEQAKEIFAGMLAAAHAHRNRMEKLDLANAGLTATDWLCVVGVDATTRVRLRISTEGESPDFEFRSSDRDNLWDEKGASVEERRMTGDGTVPFEGAVPEFLSRKNLVCVTPGDFGYWEIGDKVTLKLGGFHGIMPNMNMLHRLIVRHFTGRPDPRGNTWGRPAPAVSGDDWAPAVADLRNKDA